ncbi:MAG TPA: cyclodeaminase [Thermoanaerobaculaceae bacterium]|nr:cyclodeaminase [Thermoanaerobaculaceae bacterium]
MKVTLLAEAELRRCVDLDLDAVAKVEDAFTRLADGNAVMPAIVCVEIPEQRGEVDIKTAYVRGLDSFAVKIASGFFGNDRYGLPSGSGMMVLVSAKTGVPEAVLLDNGYLTDVRTGAAGAVAARHLSRATVETVGIIGAGAQARYQALALKQVREFRRVLVYGRTRQRAEGYVAEMTPRLGVEVVAAGDAETVVRSSEIVITTTPSREPYLRAEWLHPGVHITAMGSDGPEKQELFADVLGRADLLVCDSRAQCERLGELHHARTAGCLPSEDRIAELGEITSGRRHGREHDAQITICDLTGTGVQDTAIALLAHRRAVERGLGLQIET